MNSDIALVNDRIYPFELANDIIENLEAGIESFKEIYAALSTVLAKV
ncbi:MAG: hypothetical protein WC784_05895 [Candidatus Shapirobacteria bacterium]|jgi:hypothetical protein